MKPNPEQDRLFAYHSRKGNWKQWGPYLSDRAWGTVREGRDDPWKNFPFEEAHKRVFRWGEDGLGGLCDRLQYLCLSFALWNGKDPILKERLFGLSNPEGNHGEDVKEWYDHLDATPTSSYLKMAYRYPSTEFPYHALRTENQKRTRTESEFELRDTGVFANNAFFDVLFEYAKVDEEDLFCKVSATNRGAASAQLTLIPQVWFRNTWSFGYPNGPTGDDGKKPALREEQGHIVIQHDVLGTYFLYLEKAAPLLFCENEEGGSYPKDTFHQIVLNAQKQGNPRQEGTKAGALYPWQLEPGQTETISLRLSKTPQKTPFADKDATFAKRIEEADQFYAAIQNQNLSPQLKQIQRKAFAGLLFSKQFYYLNQSQWQKETGSSRNRDWDHLATFDILSMPDKWEYPYFCAWDSAFHCIPMVMIDPDFAKRQLELMTREWYIHPNGKFPAYEWAFSDLNPPVQAWAIWRVYKIDGKAYGKLDRPFLEGLFHKLLLNFTWWVNRVDADGNNIFQGGFLGMDNISFWDRNRALPTGGHIDQSDGTAWVSFYCLSMLKISIHLAEEEPVYQDMATKFFEHFLRIAAAMNGHAGSDHSLWDSEDHFFYDALHLPSGAAQPLKIRSLVGLLPLLAVETLESDLLAKMPILSRRIDWFIHKRPDVSCNLACIYQGGTQDRRLLSIVTKEQLVQILRYVLDENEFLSPFGIRSLSKFHEAHPYTIQVDGQTLSVNYLPGESDNALFGGNSNWRGPIWFPINFLLIEALQKYHHYYGDELKVEFPTGSGHFLNLWDVAKELSKRLIHLIAEQPLGDPLFYEYYHAETGKGLGASHQTGWTALVAKLIQQSGEFASF